MPAKIPSQVGLKYGRLTITEEKFIDKKRIAFCVCDCGKPHSVNVHKLRIGHTTSCGCFNQENLKKPKLESQSGKKYGRLLIIHDYLMGGNKRKVDAVCDCGKKLTTFLNSLRSGNTNSCGCYRSESVTNNNTTHNMSRSSEYHCWATMIQRCTNPKNKKYLYYGGRGISVCQEWMSFQNFINDMGKKPSPNLSIDRINNDGNYCKENCRWTDHFTQMNNTRKNVKKYSVHQLEEAK